MSAMPLQVRTLRVVIAAAFLGAGIALPFAVIADGGYFAQTSHGNPTTGIQRDAALPRGDCAQCHVGHGQNPLDFGLWTANDNDVCFTCHADSLRSYLGQTIYNTSGHAVSSSSFDGRPVGRCVQCHNPHGAGDSGGMYDHLTARLEEQACFFCHGTGLRPPTALDIQTQMNKPYAHKAGDFQRKHDDNAESISVAVDPNPRLSGSNRHVECADCHNTHYARTNPRPAASSNIGEMLLGSWGVRPTYSGSPWTAPTTYAVERFQDTATKYEYYLCFKCHSNWAWGTTPPYTTDGTLETNTAIEFNPANPAYHNVTGQAASAVPSHDLVEGTANAPAYLSPWGPNSAMACSDCHAGDPSTGSVRGSHGSTYNYLLKKRFKAQAGASDNTGMSGTQSDLCFGCHDWNTYGPGASGTQTNYRKGTGNLHRKSEHARGCFQCHSAVPHGYQRKHMIVYVTDGPPYFAAGTRGILSWTHAAGGAYQKSNCTTTSGCHGG
jgi:predicted CXXCH cytochrome family protein